MSKGGRRVAKAIPVVLGGGAACDCSGRRPARPRTPGRRLDRGRASRRRDHHLRPGRPPQALSSSRALVEPRLRLLRGHAARDRARPSPTTRLRRPTRARPRRTAARRASGPRGAWKATSPASRFRWRRSTARAIPRRASSSRGTSTPAGKARGATRPAATPTGTAASSFRSTTRGGGASSSSHIVPSRSTRTRAAISSAASSESSRSCVEVDAPFDAKGIGLVTYRYKSADGPPSAAKNDDTWVYVPTLRRVRRISTCSAHGRRLGHGLHLRRSERVQRNPSAIRVDLPGRAGRARDRELPGQGLPLHPRSQLRPLRPLLRRRPLGAAPRLQVPVRAEERGPPLLEEGDLHRQEHRARSSTRSPTTRRASSGRSSTTTRSGARTRRSSTSPGRACPSRATT